MAKTAKAVQDATGASLNVWFGDDTANGFTQKMNISDESGNPNSLTSPIFQKSVGVNYFEPASFQTSANLGIGASYSSSVEDALSQPNLQILARGSHAYTITVTQYRDAGGTLLMQTNVFTRSAGIQVLENMQITGNYVKIVYANTSGIAMTETMLYASLGILPLTVDQLGTQASAKSMSITPATEFVGQKASSASMPVVIASDYELTGKVLRNSPVIAANAARNPARTNQFYEPIVHQAGYRQFALENTFWVAPINPTIGTAVALGTATATSYVGTAPSILIRNAAAASGKDILINAIELSCITAGAGLTDLWVEVHIDTANRYTSGGSAITGKTLYSQTATTAFTAFNASTAIVATADTTTYTRLFRRKIRTAIPVAGDSYKLIFDSMYDGGSYALNSTVASIYNIQAPVCVIPPVGTMLVYIFWTAMSTAPTWEGTIEFTER
jgi:hypothetical protein